MARIMRIIRVLRFMTSPRIVATMILESVVCLFWVLVFLLGVVYVFSIMMTQLANDHRFESKFHSAEADDGMIAWYWGDLFSSWLTLFASVAGGLSWIELADMAAFLGPVYVPVLFMFICFMTFSVLQVVTAVVVDGAILRGQRDRGL